MTWVAAAIGGAAVVGAVVQSQSSRRAARSQEQASEAGIESQESAQAQFNLRTQPFADLGLSAGDAISDLLGLPRTVTANPEIARLQSQLSALDTQIKAGPERRGRFGGPLGQLTGGLTGDLIGDELTGLSLGTQLGGAIDRRRGDTGDGFDISSLNAQRQDLQGQIESLQAEDQTRIQAAQTAQPGGQFLEQINPLVDFFRQEGFEDIQESAAARGRLGAGGTLKDLSRFNTQLAGTLVPQLQNQRFNQLFNLLGLGANAATGQGTAALQTGANVSNLLGNIGGAQAQNQLNQGQIASGLTNQLAGVFGAQQGGAFQRQPPPQQAFTDATPPNRFEAFS